MSVSNMPEDREEGVPKAEEPHQPVMTSKKNNPYLSSDIITSSQRVEP